MPKRDPDLLIEDILAAIQKIERYTAGMDQEIFRQDEKTVDAVVRNLEGICLPSAALLGKVFPGHTSALARRPDEGERLPTWSHG